MKADFVVVANRLPVDIIDHPNGEVEYRTSPGGLVTALKPVLQAHQGSWVGWPGTTDDEREPFSHDGLQLVPVTLTQRNFEDFYEGFSNATLWPLYHDLIVRPIYHREWWEDYGHVNHQFALKVAECAAEGATVWVQDYQLQLVPGILKQIRPDLRIGFFLHIPFPAPELFRQLPWREEILRGLLGADLLGFHTVHNAQNFLDLAHDVSGFARPSTGQPQNLTIEGTPQMGTADATVTASDGRRVRVGVFPISIYSQQVIKAADTADTDSIRAELNNPKKLILGVDRLDYTKGILNRLKAFEELLEDGTINPDDVVFYQIATPSRERIEHYKEARRAVEEAVGRINGRFGSLGHQVVHYMHRGLPFDQLVGLYRAADVMVVSALKDGMNLVAKEYVASHSDGSGALVLSEFTGAAAELNGAYLCNPFDIDDLKSQLYQALHDDDDRRRQRMAKLFDQVKNNDVHLWAANFLGALDTRLEED